MTRLIAALLILLASSQLQAAIKPYAEARVGAGGVRHSELDFYPQFGSFSAGVFVYGNIGIEGFVSTSISDFEKDGFTLDVTESSGVALRLQSPPQYGGMQAYLLLGYVNFNLEQKENSLAGRRTVQSSFNGARIAIGVHQRFKSARSLMFGVEYRNDYAETGITVDGLSVGLRYELR